MSLVAYADSDASEDDSSEDAGSDKLTGNVHDSAREVDKELGEEIVEDVRDSVTERDEELDNESAAPQQQQPAVANTGDPPNPQKLFSRLPPPKHSATTLHDPSLQDVVVKQANKSTKSKRAQILIPSLNEFDDEEEEEEENKKKKFRPAQIGSGLIGMLPAPKHGSLTTKQMTPHVVARPPPPRKPVSKQPVRKSQAPAVPQPSTSYPWEQDDGDDADTTEDTPNFFTFSEPPLPKVNIDAELQAADASIPSTAHARSLVSSSYGEQEPGPEPQPSVNVEPGPDVQPPAPSRKGKIVYAEPEEPGTSVYDVELDDGALVRLRGKRQEEINIIDVCADNQIDKTQILIRGLTEQPTYSSHSNTSDFNTSQQHRRKHQITYLAQQAKAREQELKNTWAQNRMTKRQTQAKYGF
uniref:Proline-rich protein PRCC n=1 Tax=Rhipicephalus appendiculatus TaxID=34631 RepID=A0A131YZQ6_RHIAP